MDNELYHFGILGMRWGVRRTPAQLGHKPKARSDAEKARAKVRSINDKADAQVRRIKKKGLVEGKIAKAEERAASKIAKAEAKYLPKKKQQVEGEKPKSVKEMSDSELSAKIDRIRLETTYRELTTPSNKAASKGKKFIMDVLESSAKNVATQTATYLMGTAVNKMIEATLKEKNAINPKKGQKDK